mgnify:CR=1 FL=1
MKSKDTPTEENPSNQFVDMLTKHRRGFALDKASTKLREALIASRDTGAKSTVTMTVTLTPGTDDQMAISIQVAAKLPDEKLPSGMFWVDDDGSLRTSDPRQKELQIREVIPVGARAIEQQAKEA